MADKTCPQNPMSGTPGTPTYGPHKGVYSQEAKKNVCAFCGQS
jgi:hypothetical protein